MQKKRFQLVKVAQFQLDVAYFVIVKNQVLQTFLKVDQVLWDGLQIVLADREILKLIQAIDAVWERVQEVVVKLDLLEVLKFT
jgi:hypothetical protein